MSDSRDAKNARQLENRIATMNASGYGQLDPEMVYRLAINNPAGFGDMSTTAPGTVLPASAVDQAFATFKAGAYDDGSERLTLDEFVADPRSAIKVQDGRYVYRPDLATGDFPSKDRESLMESLGAFPFVLAAFAAPFAASLGAATGAAEAGGINAVNSFDSGAMAEILNTAPATLTAPAGAGSLVSALKPIGTVAGAVGSVAGAVGSVASATGAVVQSSRLMDAATETTRPAALPIASNPFVFNLPGADMAAKSATQTASTVAPTLNMQTLLTLAVVAVIAFAVLDQVKE
jgi:hypothetical protein